MNLSRMRTTFIPLMSTMVMRLALNQRLFRAFVAVARSRTATFFAPQPRSLDDVALFAPPRGVLKRVPVPVCMYV